DGDRASWNRRRRELQNAVASVLKEPADLDDLGPPDRSGGTTYASSAAYGEDEPVGEPIADEEAVEAADAEATDPEPEQSPDGAAEGGGRHSAAGSASGSRFLADAGH